MRLQKQDEQLKAQQDILKRQEDREERVLNFMQQMLMMMPAAGTQVAGTSMYAMALPPPTHPLHPTEVPFPGYPTYPAQDLNKPDNKSDDE